MIDALDELTYAETTLRNMLSAFAAGTWTNMHILEANTATTPTEIPLRTPAFLAIIRHRDDIPTLRAELARLLEEY